MQTEAVLCTEFYYESPRLPDKDLGLKADAGRHGMLSHPELLIPPLVYALVRVLPLSYAFMFVIDVDGSECPVR